MKIPSGIKHAMQNVREEFSALLPKENTEKQSIVSAAKTSLNALKIKMPGADDYVELGDSQIKRIYKDPVGPRLLVIIDESAELLKPSGVKNKEGKEEDQLKQEMAMIIQSLAQLGRSAGVHLIICTQRAEVAAIAGGNTRENSLALDTKVITK